MFKKLVPALAATALLATAVPSAQAAFEVGGTGGWSLSTDGIVDVFAPYQTVSPVPGGTRSASLLSNSTGYDQEFGVKVGLLPSVVAFNVKAPTVNGIESSVRVGIYPNIQNTSSQRFNTSPNIDFREFYYNAKGSYGELLAGRALNLYQGKNILTDMTLLTAGVVGIAAADPFRGGTTLGHIGYGYLYTNFGPQIRYTTPDLSGAKFAIAVAEPYKISSDTSKTNSPRIETELSYSTKVGGNTLQAWGSAIYQTAPRSNTAAARKGASNESIGGALGLQYGFSGIDLLASGYYGQGLGMLSVQDGTLDALLSSAVDNAGNERTQYGFLLQSTYQLTSSVKLGVNYGQTAQKKSSADNAGNLPATGIPMLKQEAAVGMVSYNLTKFLQFVGEYTYAQNTWMDGAKQHANSITVGTMFYW